jgi:MbtH protein
MNAETSEQEPTYVVVVNEEEQYSIWPVDRDIPLGWTDADKRGTRSECLEYIDQTWTDMRPRSLRDLIQRRDE